MGVSKRAFSEKQRLRALRSGQIMKEYKEKRKDIVDGGVNTNKTTCSHCGFEAYYEFIRCPECDKRC